MSAALNATVELVDERWGELNSLVESLGSEGLTIAGPDGWAVKDHLAHIAAWEHSLLALLEKRDRHAAMGVGPELNDTDAINAAVWSLHRGKTAEEALAYFHATHELLMQRLRGMSDADLQLSYNHFQPNAPADPAAGSRPVIGWVAGNTYDHYAEHIQFINQLIESRAAR